MPLTPDKDGTIAIKRIESPLDSYRTFFDHDWAKQLIEQTAGTQLSEAVGTLCMNWKQAANVHQVPWLMAHMMGAFSATYSKSYRPYGDAIFDGVASALITRMDDELSHMKKQTIRKHLREIGQAMNDADGKPVGVNPYSWWGEAVMQEEMQLIIFASQNSCYCSLVFAYEWFVVCCFRLLGGDADTRTANPRFWGKLSGFLGRDCKDEYWYETRLVIAREVRNSFAHKGGKAKPEVIDELKRIADEDEKIYVSPDGDITIMPTDNWNLFRLLRGKVSKLVDEVLLKLT